MPDGLLLIDKPVGLRSTDCVGRIKRALGRGVRVGHAGTLDSTASGLLVVLVGAGTRLSDYVMRLSKCYTATFRLGSATDTCDASGSSVFEGDASAVSEFGVDRVLCSFQGVRMQSPPAISALKVDGTPSHRLARAGTPLKLQARPTLMTRVERTSPVAENSFDIFVTCSKGTYIRSLARDIGERLGCGAHVARLRRLSVGPFDVADAVDGAEIDASGDVAGRIRSMREVARSFHRLRLTCGAERLLSSGQTVLLAEAGRYLPGAVELKQGLCVEGDAMIGFVDLISDGERWLLKPRANIMENLSQSAVRVGEADKRSEDQ